MLTFCQITERTAWLDASTIWPKVGVTAGTDSSLDPSVGMNDINILSVTFIKPKAGRDCYEKQTSRI